MLYSLLFSVNPHSEASKRRSVADILDEEFDLLDGGDTRMNSYKQAGLSAVSTSSHYIFLLGLKTHL